MQHEQAGPPPQLPTVLSLCNVFRSPALGGIEKLRVEVTTRLRSVRPVVLTDLLDEDGESPSDQVEVHRVALDGDGLISRVRSSLLHRGANVMVARVASMLIPALRLCRLYDIGCVECGNSNLGYVGYLLYRLRGIPYVVHVNSCEDRVVTGDYGRFSRPISRAIFDNAAAVIGNSHAIQRYVQQSVKDPTKVHAVPMGVDNVSFSPGRAEPPADLAARLRDRHVLLSASRLVEYKGVDTVIRALPTIAEAVPDVLYVIAGHGPDRGRLEELTASLGLGDRVLFAGPRYGDELPSLYRSCNLFVLISRGYEGLPQATLEAAACGRPVVVGDRGGQTETVTPNVSGYVVPSESADSVKTLAAACIEVLTCPDREARMGRAGRELAASMSFDTAAKAVEEILLSVIGKRSPLSASVPS